MGERLFVGLQNDAPVVAIDDDLLTARDVGEKLPGADDRGDFEPLGDNGSVAAGAADFGGKTQDKLAVQSGGLAGGQVVRQDNHRRIEVR